jgi:hypothetical protein
MSSSEDSATLNEILLVLCASPVFAEAVPSARWPIEPEKPSKDTSSACCD